MTTIKGRGILAGKAEAPALVSKTPINLTASLTKVTNLLPGKASVVMDRHHELFGQRLNGIILVFPSVIGSTYTGMVLLELLHGGNAPKGIIVQSADSLLVSGPILADVWFDAGIPVVECNNPEIFKKISTGDKLKIDGGTGEIEIT